MNRKGVRERASRFGVKSAFAPLLPSSAGSSLAAGCRANRERVSIAKGQTARPHTNSHKLYARASHARGPVVPGTSEEGRAMGTPLRWRDAEVAGPSVRTFHTALRRSVPRRSTSRVRTPGLVAASGWAGNNDLRLNVDLVGSCADAHDGMVTHAHDPADTWRVTVDPRTNSLTVTERCLCATDAAVVRPTMVTA
jgi:hypothetical protein